VCCVEELFCRSEMARRKVLSSSSWLGPSTDQIWGLSKCKCMYLPERKKKKKGSSRRG
jgi:hypothetical protein